MKRSDFKITRTQDGWRLTNVTAPGDRHAHFWHKNGAKMCLKWILKGVLPEKPYFQAAAKRVLVERDFKKLVPGKTGKDPYINVQRTKGGLRCANVRR